MTDPVRVRALIDFNVDTKAVEKDVQKALKNMFGSVKKGGIKITISNLKEFRDAINAFKAAISELKAAMSEMKSKAKTTGTGESTAQDKQRKRDLTAEIAAKERTIRLERALSKLKISEAQAQVKLVQAQTQQVLKNQSSQAQVIKANAQLVKANADAQAKAVQSQVSLIKAQSESAKNQALATKIQAQAQAAQSQAIAAEIKANSDAAMKAAQAEALLIRARAQATAIEQGGGPGGPGGGGPGGGGGGGGGWNKPPPEDPKVTLAEAVENAKRLAAPLTNAEQRLEDVRNTFMQVDEIARSFASNARVSALQSRALMEVIVEKTKQYRQVAATFGPLFSQIASMAEQTGAAFGQQLVGGISLAEKSLNKEFKQTIDKVSKFAVRSVQDINDTITDLTTKMAMLRSGATPPTIAGATGNQEADQLGVVVDLLVKRRDLLQQEMVQLNRIQEVLSRNTKIAETRQRIEQKTNVALASGADIINRSFTKDLPDIIARNDPDEIRAVAQEYEGAARQTTNAINSLQRLLAETTSVLTESKNFREQLNQRIRDNADAVKKAYDELARAKANGADEATIADLTQQVQQKQELAQIDMQIKVGLEQQIKAMEIQIERTAEMIRVLQEEKVAMNGNLSSLRSLRREGDELARIIEQTYRRQVQLRRQTSVLLRDPLMSEGGTSKLDPFNEEDVSLVKRRIREVSKQLADLEKNNIRIDVALDDSLAELASDFENMQGQFASFRLDEADGQLSPEEIKQMEVLYQRMVKALREKAAVAKASNDSDIRALKTARELTRAEQDGFLDKAKAVEKINRLLEKGEQIRLKAIKNEVRQQQAGQMMAMSGDPAAQLLGVQQIKKVGSEASSLADQILQLNFEIAELTKYTGALTKEQTEQVQKLIQLRDALMAKSAEVSRNSEALARQEKQAKRAGQSFKLYSASLADSIKQQFAFANAISIVMGGMFAVRTAFMELINESRAFARTMVVVQSKTETFTKAYEMLKQEVRETSVEFGRSVEEVAEIAKQFGSAGFSLEQTMAALRSTTQVVIATNADAETTTRAIAGVYRVYTDELKAAGSEMAAFKRINDVMLGVYRNHQVEIDELVQGFRFSASAAKMSGFSFSENAAMLSVLNDNMIKSGTAGRGLQVILAQMAAKTEAVEKAYGVMIDRSKPLTDQFLSVLEQVNVQLRTGERTIQDLDVGFKIFGLRGLRSFNVLAEKFPDLIKTMKQLDKESKGLSAELSQIVKNELATQFDAAKQSLIDLARSFIEPSKSLLILVTQMVKDFRDLYLALGPVASALNQIVFWGAALGVTAVSVRAVLMLFGTLSVEIGAFGSRLLATSKIVKFFTGELSLMRIEAMAAQAATTDIGTTASRSAKQIGGMSTSMSQMATRAAAGMMTAAIGIAALAVIFMNTRTSLRELNSELDQMSSNFSKIERSLRELSEFEEQLQKIASRRGEVTDRARAGDLIELMRNTNKEVITGISLNNQLASTVEANIESNIAALKREARERRAILELEEEQASRDMRVKAVETLSKEIGQFDFSEFGLWSLDFVTAWRQFSSQFKDMDGNLIQQDFSAFSKRMEVLDDAEERMAEINNRLRQARQLLLDSPGDSAIASSLRSELDALTKERNTILDAQREYERVSQRIIVVARSQGKVTEDQIKAFATSVLAGGNATEAAIKKIVERISVLLTVPISFEIPVKAKDNVRELSFGFLQEIVTSLDAPLEVQLFDNFVKEMDFVIAQMEVFDGQIGQMQRGLFISNYNVEDFSGTGSEFNKPNEGLMKQIIGAGRFESIKKDAERTGGDLGTLLMEGFADVLKNFDTDSLTEVVAVDAKDIENTLKQVFSGSGIEFKNPAIAKNLEEVFGTAIKDVEHLTAAVSNIMVESLDNGETQVTIGSLVAGVKSIQQALVGVGDAAAQSADQMSLGFFTTLRQVKLTFDALESIRSAYTELIGGMRKAISSKANLNPLEQLLNRAEGLRQILTTRSKNRIGIVDEASIAELSDVKLNEMLAQQRARLEEQQAAVNDAMAGIKESVEGVSSEEESRSSEMLNAMIETLNLETERTKIILDIQILRAKETYELRKANKILFNNVRLESAGEDSVRNRVDALADEVTNRIKIATLEQVANRRASIQQFFISEFVELLDKALGLYHDLNEQAADEVASRYETLEILEKITRHKDDQTSAEQALVSSVVRVNELNRRLIAQQARMSQLSDNSFEAQSKVAEIVGELAREYNDIISMQDDLIKKEETLNQLASDRHDIYKQIADLLKTEMDDAIESLDNSISRQFENSGAGIDEARRLAKATGMSVDEILYNKEEAMSRFFDKMKTTWTPSVGILGAEFQALGNYITETSLRQQDFEKRARELARQQAGLELRTFGIELGKNTKEGVDKAEQALSRYQGLIEKSFDDPEQQIQALELYLKLREELLKQTGVEQDNYRLLVNGVPFDQYLDIAKQRANELKQIIRDMLEDVSTDQLMNVLAGGVQAGLGLTPDSRNDFVKSLSDLKGSVDELTKVMSSVIDAPTVNKSTGGYIPGYGGGDKIPARLEAGEYVIPKNIVRRFGVSFFNAIRAGKAPGFNKGGVVGKISSTLGDISSSPIFKMIEIIKASFNQIGSSFEDNLKKAKEGVMASLEEANKEAQEISKAVEEGNARLEASLETLTTSLGMVGKEIVGAIESMGKGGGGGGGGAGGSSEESSSAANAVAAAKKSTESAITNAAGQTAEQELKAIDKVTKSRKNSLKDEGRALADIESFTVKLRKQAQKLEDFYPIFNSLVDTAMSGIANAAGAIVKSLNAVLVPEFAKQNAEAKRNFIETLIQIEKTFETTFEGATKQLQRNETSYYSYLNAIQDAEQQRQQERLAAEEAYRQSLIKTSEVFGEVLGSFTDSISKGIEDASLSMSEAAFGDLASSLKGAIAVPLMGANDWINDVVDSIGSGANEMTAAVSGAMVGLETGVSDTMDGVRAAIQAGAKEAEKSAKSVEKSSTTIGEKIRGALGGGANIAMGIGGAAFGGMISAATSLVGLTASKDGGSGLIEFVEKFFDELPEAAPAFVDRLIDNTERIIEALGEGIPVLIETLVEETPRFMEALIASLETAVPAIVEAVAESTPVLVQKITPMLVRLVVLILNQVPRLIEGVAESIPILIIEVIKGLPAIAIALVKAIVNGLISAIKGLFKGLIGGLFGGIFHEGGVVKSVSQEALILAKRGEGILTPDAVNRLGGERAIDAINAGRDLALARPMVVEAGVSTKQSSIERRPSQSNVSTTTNNLTLSTELTGRETDSELRERSEKLLSFIDEGLAKRTKDRRSRLAKVF